MGETFSFYFQRISGAAPKRLQIVFIAKLWRCSLSKDVNECGDFTNGGCEQLCANHPGGFTCTCREGYNVRTDDLTRCQRESAS